MKMKNIALAITTGLLALVAQSAMASTYYLNQSNTLADGVNYAKVDVIENAGNLNFTVSALTPSNWQFSNFYFNLGGSTGSVSLLGLPSGWTAKTTQNVSEFGVFSNGEKGTGSTLQSGFSFTADSTTNLTLANLVANSSGWIFAAHVQCQSNCIGLDVNNQLVTSHHIAGPGAVSAVPLPAAGWLFGSALLGFISLSNRRKV